VLPNTAASRRPPQRPDRPWRPARLAHHAAVLLASLPMYAAGPVLLVVSGSLAAVAIQHSGIPGTWGLDKGSVLFGGLLFGVLAVAAVAGRLTAMHRWRLHRLAGLDIPARPAGERLTWRELGGSVRSAAARGAFTRRVAARARWTAIGRQLCYHLLAAPAAGLVGLLGFAAAVAGPALAVIYVYVARTHQLVHQWELAGPAVGGFLLLLAVPWLLASAAWLDTAAAAAMLGPDRAGALARRVEVLTQSRAGVVDAADTERRRIERDLHDGAQQRLVSLAMNLGIARAGLTDVPDEARQVIEDAHEEAKAVLADLRDLVRGLHPAILEDRGLDAALSGVAARAPFPVRLRVDVPARPSPMVEAVAYFVVSEALANATKHAQASRAEVTVRQADGVLRVSVTDNGVGGADPARGTGLAGLARRAGSVDGTFTLTSPPGGPTQIVVELPCGR
jgi:signal transduction histidine kinase